MNEVLIVVTGGTIDKIHDPSTEALAFAKDDTTHMPELLGHSRCYFPRVLQLMLKDSIEFDDADRQAIVHAIQTAPEQAVVVTHGTSTLADSARWISKCVTNKTVVLTGAMRPYSLGSSDGPFNLGGAIVAAQVLSEGIYGVMNGRIFEADALRKNLEAGRFDV